MEWPIGSIEVDKIPEKPSLIPNKLFPRISIKALEDLKVKLIDPYNSTNCFRGILVIKKPQCKTNIEQLASNLSSFQSLTILKNLINVKKIYEYKYLFGSVEQLIFMADLPNITKNDPRIKEYEDMITTRTLVQDVKTDNCTTTFKFYVSAYIDKDSKFRNYEEYFIQSPRSGGTRKNKRVRYRRSRRHRKGSVK